jgi:hypothetical protein
MRTDIHPFLDNQIDQPESGMGFEGNLEIALCNYAKAKFIAAFCPKRPTAEEAIEFGLAFDWGFHAKFEELIAEHIKEVKARLNALERSTRNIVPSISEIHNLAANESELDKAKECARLALLKAGHISEETDFDDYYRRMLEQSI